MRKQKNKTEVTHKQTKSDMYYTSKPQSCLYMNSVFFVSAKNLQCNTIRVCILNHLHPYLLLQLGSGTMHYEENLIVSCHRSHIPFNYSPCMDIYAYKWLI